MNMNKIFISILLVAFFVQFGTAQKKKAWLKAAEQAFTVEEDYYKAFKYYDAALKYKKEADYFHLLYRKAESARLIGAPLDAANIYQQLLAEAPEDTLSRAPYQDVWARLGEVQITLAYTGGGLSPDSYAAAAKSFDNYNGPTVYGPDGVGDAVGNGQAVIDFVNNGQQLLANESIQPVMSDFDTEYPNFARAPWPWAPEEETASKPGERFYPQFYIAGNGGQYYASSTGNLPGCMRIYLGNTAINQNRSRVYYSACETQEGGVSTNCNIYYQNLDYNGLPTGERMEIPELKTGSADIVQIQPVISWDAVNNREVLYFVSNRGGGRGGMDIWKSEYDQENDRFSMPANVEAVNSSGDEITPFYQNEVLYFSSNGRPDRYGGFDLFSWNVRWRAPENMGQKINSSADDFGYSLNATGDRAFFTSNRMSVFLSNEEMTNSCNIEDPESCCCLSNYTYEVPPCYLEVETVSHCGCPGTYDCQPVLGADLKLIDITEDGNYTADTQGIGPSSIRENKYYFNDRLRAGRKYQVVGVLDQGDGQLEEWSQVLDFTYGQDPCADGPPSIPLEFKCKDAKLTVEVYRSGPDGETRLPDARVRIVEITQRSTGGYGSGAYSYSTTAEQAPCDDVDDLSASIDGEVEIDAFSPHRVQFNRTYMIIADANQDQYSYGQPLLAKSDTVVISESDAAFCGLACEKVVRITLEAPEAPPALEVFFDNARPLWENAPYGDRNIAAESYLRTLEKYKARGDEYLRQFNTGSAEDDAQKLELGIFIPNELNNKETELRQFVADVKELLCLKVPVTIKAIGCTSPKFKDPGEQEQIDFNAMLENRRVDCVQRELHNLGLSTDYYSNYNFEIGKSGEMITEDKRACEETNLKVDPKDLQDQNNPKLSVFSIDAAKYRRVELYVILAPPDSY